MHEFKKAARKLELDRLALCPHMFRNGGAPRDYATITRSLLAIQARGGWRAFQNVQRYNKHSRLGIVLQALSHVQRRRFGQSEETLSKLFAPGSDKSWLEREC